LPDIQELATASACRCFPLILLTLMTYLVMPAATRLVAAWLYPERD
jgi:antibiotic biosynthesis monooxygenase (ABM) superfamily enzyme